MEHNRKVWLSSLLLLGACALTPEQRSQQVARIARDLAADLALARELAGPDSADVLQDLALAAGIVAAAVDGETVTNAGAVLVAARESLPALAAHLVARGVPEDRVLLYTVGARRLLSRAEQWFAQGF